MKSVEYNVQGIWEKSLFQATPHIYTHFFNLFQCNGCVIRASVSFSIMTYYFQEFSSINITHNYFKILLSFPHTTSSIASCFTGCQFFLILLNVVNIPFTSSYLLFTTHLLYLSPLLDGRYTSCFVCRRYVDKILMLLSFFTPLTFKLPPRNFQIYWFTKKLGL